jgi:hypothetical protein
MLMCLAFHLLNVLLRFAVRLTQFLAMCENRVTRLCTVVTGTAFATDALRPTVN